MDCKTARLLLYFARPRADELAAAELEGLDAHLVDCPTCGELASAERRVDHALGRAMRQVEVPDQLRARVLARLAADRADWYRRWAGHAARAVAAAAAVLLVAWGGWQLRAQHRPQINVEAALIDYGNQRLNNREEAEAYFQRLGVRVSLPDALNYALLTHCGLRELPGHPGVAVPSLEFTQGANKADVFVVSGREFDVQNLQFDPAQRQGYSHKLRIERHGRDALLVFSTRENLGWFWPGKDAAVNEAN
jgi:hypothetical protein